MSKIIIIGPAHPLRGGIATFNERMAQQLNIQGHETVIYSFSLQYPDFLFPGKTQYSESAPPNDLTIYSTINSINPISWVKTAKKIRQEKPDIVIFRYWLPFMAPCLGTIARIVAKDKDIRIIGFVDNALPHEKRIGDHNLTRYFVKPMQSFIAMSEKVVRDLKTFTQRPIQLIPHPLYDNFGKKEDKIQARRHLGLPEEGTILLFFGFIRKYKGLDMLIQALEHTDMRHKHLVIAGEYYADEEEIKALIQKSSVQGSIIEHTHFIKNEEVRWYFSAADIVIQPYRNATQSGVTPLAYHFEIPMIVTDVGGLKEQVPQALGIVCQPNVEDIAQAITAMDNFDHVAFKHHIKIEKQKLSWDALVDTILG